MILWTVLGLYLSIILLGSIPAVQRYMGNTAAALISDKLGTRVEVGSVSYGLLNRFVVDDLSIYDKSGLEMLKVSRASAKLSIRELLRGNIVITSSQLFGANAKLYKANVHSMPNYQFVIDSLKSDSDKPSELHLAIHSLIVRNGEVSYDVTNVPETKGILNPSHLHISNLSSHIVLKNLTDKAFDIKVKRLSFSEKSSLDVRSLIFRLKVDDDKYVIKDFTFELPSTKFHTDSICIDAGKQFMYAAKLDKSYINLTDLKCLDKSLDINKHFSLSCNIDGDKDRCNIQRLLLGTADKGLLFDGDIRLYNMQNSADWMVHVRKFFADTPTHQLFANKLIKDRETSEMLSRLGNIIFVGDINSRDKTYTAKGELTTGTGKISLDLSAVNDVLNANISTPDLNLETLLGNNRLGTVAGTVSIRSKGLLRNAVSSHVVGKADVKHVYYNGSRYQNISFDGAYHDRIFDGTLSMDDPNNGVAKLKGYFNWHKRVPENKFTASLQGVDLSRFSLSDMLSEGVVSCTVDANTVGSNMDDLYGFVNVNNFVLKNGKNTFSFDSLRFNATHDNKLHNISLTSDFAAVDVSGEFNYRTIVNSLKRLVINKIPTLSKFTNVSSPINNRLSMHAVIRNADFLKLLHDKDIVLETPVYIEGMLDDTRNAVNMTFNADKFSYDGTRYENAVVNMKTSADTLYVDGTIDKLSADDTRMNLDVRTKAIDDRLLTDVVFSNNTLHPFGGELSFATDFIKSLTGGQPTVATTINPSEVHFDNISYNVEPSEIVYSNGKLLIDHFAIENNNQHIFLSGMATKHSEDTVKVDLQNINVDYISSLLNVNGVEFSGIASGKVSATSVLSSPQVEAGIQVDSFRFVNGRLGTMYADASWSKAKNSIDIKAVCDDGPLAKTNVDGYVSLENSYLDLDIETHNTRIEFLEHYIGSFMDNIEARAEGKIKVFGPLSNVNIEGRVVADGDVEVKPLSTKYTLRNDTVSFYPNRIVFSQDTVYDVNNKPAVVNGAVMHNYLKNFRYDINVDANDVLAFNKNSFGDDTFRGTVFATGNCHVVGGSGETEIDIVATPEKGSVIEYNVGGTSSVGTQSFIQWHDKKTKNSVKEKTVADDSDNSIATFLKEMPSNLYMNFLIDANPNLTLRLLMNEDNGDYIDLHGRGVIQANYFNKGAFEMFGNYLVESGIYKMTIQNVLKKEFQFYEGSSIVFGGNPYYAALDLRAMYPINGVSLSDLNIGNSFSSNNVRVNCLMNIGGTPMSPNVDFDFEMPTASANAEQMVRSLINSEEELNQQVIYLLTIGRFYSQGANNASQDGTSPSQTSLAMQSLLSGTLSQQLNSMLSSVLNVSNWNFGANISTGNEGWNNAEYEGLLSGRLLNNRLLINGQFGYRDNPNATSFIGDFDIRYLLFPNGNLALKVYNQSNDRYFTRNSLNTQGIGIIMKKDFSGLRDLFNIKKNGKKTKKQSSEPADSTSKIQPEQ